MVDRIISVPSEWMKSVTLLVLWFSLHMGDSLVETMFELCPILQQELSRLHMLLNQFVNEQFRAQNLNHDEEAQLKIL